MFDDDNNSPIVAVMATYVAIYKLLDMWDKNIVNLSSGKEYSIKEYAKIICDIIGYDFNLIEWDTTAFVGSPNKKLINTHLQDFKFTPLTKGLIETIKYYETRSSSSK